MSKPRLTTPLSPARSKLKAAIDAVKVARDRHAEAEEAVDAAIRAAAKLEREAEELTKGEEKPQDFETYDDAIAAIKKGTSGVLEEVDKSNSVVAVLSKMRNEADAWKRAKDKARQALSLRESELVKAHRNLDQAAREVVADEAGISTLLERYVASRQEQLELRAVLQNILDVMRTSLLLARWSVWSKVYAKTFILVRPVPSTPNNYLKWVEALRLDPTA